MKRKPDTSLHPRQQAMLRDLPRPKDLFYTEDHFFLHGTRGNAAAALQDFDDALMRQVRTALDGRSTKSFTKPDPDKGKNYNPQKVNAWRASTLRFLVRAGRVQATSVRRFHLCDCCWYDGATALNVSVTFYPHTRPASSHRRDR